jgi:nuclear pore complex protein Nup205
MEVGPEGPPRQQAVLQGLKLLNMALEYDTAAAEQLSALSVRERVAPLQGLLASSPRRLAGLLQYVLYADTDIQLEVRNSLFKH